MKIERDKVIGFTATQKEHAEIHELAKRNGMTVSAYIRYLVKQELEKERNNG